ncbi:MAG: hypothetical protein KDF60_18715 [Calditrichaeota bacterium]|nr:hypothetical protein [Calditrichota bacterium]
MKLSKDDLEKNFTQYLDLATIEVDSIEWVTRLEKEDPIVISAIIARLGSTGTLGARWDALRDSAITVLETKLTNQIINTMEKLDKSSSKLSKVGIILTVFIGILGLIIAI